MISSNREQIRKQRQCVLVVNSTLASQDVKLLQLRLGAVLTGQARRLSQKSDRRIERRIRMVWGTFILNPLVPLIGKPVTQTTGHSRFSNPGLPTEEHDLPFAADGFTPAIQQKCDFVLSAHETR